MSAGNAMKNVGGVGNLNCRVKKESIKCGNNNCVEEVLGMLCPEELFVYR